MDYNNYYGQFWQIKYNHMLDLRPHESYNLCLYCICHKAPTYVELIDLVEEAENHCEHSERLPVNLIQTLNIGILRVILVL